MTGWHPCWSQGVGHFKYILCKIKAFSLCILQQKMLKVHNDQQLELLLTHFVLPRFPSVQPFASEEEFKATMDIVRKFQEGVGKELHQKLLQRAKTKKNWVCNGALNALFWFYRCPPQSWMFLLRWLCFYSLAWRMVVRRWVSGGPHTLSAECELWRPGALPGALLAPWRGNSTAESQYWHVAYTTVLEPDPHVRHTFTSSVFVVC